MSQFRNYIYKCAHVRTRHGQQFYQIIGLKM